jgi:hypothetical protein
MIRLKDSPRRVIVTLTTVITLTLGIFAVNSWMVSTNTTAQNRSKPKMKPAEEIVPNETATQKDVAMPSSPVNSRAASSSNQADQIPFDPTLAENPVMGRGRQIAAIQNKNGSKSTHLKLRLRLKASGETEVIGATEIPGSINTSEEIKGDYVYVVNDSNNQIIASETFATDPFEQRSFPAPGSKEHHLLHKDSTELVVKVPNVAIGSTGLTNIAVKLYQIRPGDRVERLDRGVIEKLFQQNRLELKGEIPMGNLWLEVQQKGRRLKQ